MPLSQVVWGRFEVPRQGRDTTDGYLVRNGVGHSDVAVGEAIRGASQPIFAGMYNFWPIFGW